jgi:ketosteroid isomerase-like protein
MTPDTSSSATAVVRRFYQAFVTGDMATIDSLMTEDVSFHVPGTGSNAGDYQGKEAVFGFFGKAVSTTGGSLKLELLDVLAGEDHVAALATYRAERAGRAPLQNNLVQLIKLRDGRIAQSWFHSRNQYEVDAFWA